MNTITIELSAQDRERQDSLIEKMDELIAALEVLKSTGKPTEATETDTPISTQPEVQTPAPACEVAQEEVEQIAMEFEEEEEATESVPAPTITAADVQSLVVELVASGKKAETRAVIKKYAEGVSLIPEDKLPEVMQRLLEVKGK